MMPPPVVVVVFVVSSSAIAVLLWAAVLLFSGSEMCARGLLGERDVVNTVLLGQRKCAWAASSGCLRLVPNAGKSSGLPAR